MSEKSPFSKVQLQTIQAIRHMNGDQTKAATLLGVKPSIIHNRTALIRKKIERAQKIVNTSNNWKKDRNLRKILL
ncbi:unnamed protein product [marine sediment metagenome]|uniref:Uncharacterized protein n=1 Tax=marine sediment metagenome TaxID=412755 RepID=X1LR59_9ZZZZ